MIALSHKARALLERLRAHAETRVTDKEGRVWASVYLDNARGDLSPHSFAWHLGALKQAGMYRVVDGENFGDVLLA